MRGAGPGRACIKAGAVGALAPLALAHGFPLPALALALSAFGDFALARGGSRWFLLGMAAFGTVHLIYTGLFAGAGALAGVGGWSLIPAIVLVAVAVRLGRLYSAGAGALKWPLRAYVALIAAMGLAALGLPFGLLTLGAALFILSDALIGQQMFLQRRWRGQDLVIWSTYYVAQLCLAAGLTGHDIR